MDRRMINPRAHRTSSSLLAVALAEMRSARRLARYWVFAGLAFVLGFGLYLYYGMLHAIGSGLTVTAGMILSPKVLFVVVGTTTLLAMQVCLIFLAFDVRERDRRERIDEVLGTRPVSNVEVLFGRALGLVVLVWIPIIFVAAAVLAFGAIAGEVGWWIGEVEPASFLSITMVGVPVTLFLWCAVVMLLTVALRNRLVTALVALALAGLFTWVLGATPGYLVPVVGFVGSAYPSDMIPVFLTGTDVVQRMSILAIGSGLLTLAALCYARRDGGSTPLRLAAGTVLIGVGAMGMVGVAIQATNQFAESEAWANVHRAEVLAPRADVEHIAGSVVIEPGQRLAIDVDITLRPATAAATELLLSLNPGMTVETLRVDGEEADFAFESGLLKVHPATPLADRPVTVSLVAAGIPRARFAYLDSTLVPEKFTGAQAMLTQLGTEAGLFDPDYVALMPGTRWLPVAGANIDDEEPSRGRDFFTIDIEVDAPSGWTVAGPGRPETNGDNRVRFRPGAPVPAVALFAAAFERRALEVAGVTLELLLHSGHAGSFDFFADATDELKARLGEMFSEAERVGLSYPYDSLAVVEVPSRLRGYGGGWRMGTVLSQPGVLLLREFGLPIAPFDALLRPGDALHNREGGIAAAKIDALVQALADDFAGGNVFSGAVRNVLTFQTGAAGSGAVAIDFVLHDLANRLLTDHRAYFSAYRVAADFQYASQAVARNTLGGAVQSVLEAVADAATGRPSVWDRALAEPLAQLDVHDDPERALNALVLKASAIADVIYDSLGRTGASELLAELRHRYTGRNFTAADLNRTAADLGVDLDALLGSWLTETTLSGFLASDVSVGRLDDDGTGRPRYQMLLHVRNDEPTPGHFRLVYGAGQRFHEGEPIRVPGNTSVEVGMTSPDPPSRLELRPYLSLNRLPVTLALPEIDTETVQDVEPFNGVRPSDWRPRATAAVIVDDLDDGFGVQSNAAGGELGARILSFFGGIEVEMDQGLPRFNPPFYVGGENWVRQVIDTGWGKYRHTVARASGLNGRGSAEFAATLPAVGRWRLEFHLPVNPATVGDGPFGGQPQPYGMELIVADDVRPLEFDASVAEQGWNRLGEFDIASRDVRVKISNLASPGFVIYADAIRWTPL